MTVEGGAGVNKPPPPSTDLHRPPVSQKTHTTRNEMVRPRRAKLLAWTREERAAERSSAMEGRAPAARPRGGGAGDPLPPVAWVPHRGASIPRGSHGNRPDRASGKPRDLRGSENAPRDRVREPVRGHHGGQAPGAGEGGACVGGPFREARRHLPLRLHWDRERPAGARGRRVPPRVALAWASVY